ncbi:hypothetical protein HDV00_006693 [Rhizophlyctis rosea]|nr:hypothetical protein HDV00_006693 [Rhizophlyctis rosea]
MDPWAIAEPDPYRYTPVTNNVRNEIVDNPCCSDPGAQVTTYGQDEVPAGFDGSLKFDGGDDLLQSVLSSVTPSSYAFEHAAVNGWNDGPLMNDHGNVGVLPAEYGLLPALEFGESSSLGLSNHQSKEVKVSKRGRTFERKTSRRYKKSSNRKTVREASHGQGIETEAGPVPPDEGIDPSEFVMQSAGQYVMASEDASQLCLAYHQGTATMVPYAPAPEVSRAHHTSTRVSTRITLEECESTPDAVLTYIERFFLSIINESSGQASQPLRQEQTQGPSRRVFEPQRAQQARPQPQRASDVATIHFQDGSRARRPWTEEAIKLVTACVRQGYSFEETAEKLQEFHARSGKQIYDRVKRDWESRVEESGESGEKGEEGERVQGDEPD